MAAALMFWNTNMAAVLMFWNTNMAAVLLFWNTNMAAVTSCENALYIGGLFSEFYGITRIYGGYSLPGLTVMEASLLTLP